MEGIAALFLIGGLILGRWWWIAVPLALTVPIITWLVVYDATDAELYGDGPIEDTAVWIAAAIVSAVAGLAGVALHQLLLRLARSVVERSGHPPKAP